MDLLSAPEPQISRPFGYVDPSISLLAQGDGNWKYVRLPSVSPGASYLAFF